MSTNPSSEADVAAPQIRENTIWHVGVSGGKDSTAALLFMVHRSGIPKSKIFATFCDIGNDHEFTLQHVAMLSEKVHPIQVIKPDMQFKALAFKKKRFPSARARFCTEYLKIVPTADHLMKLKQDGYDPIAVSGVRADESADRAKLPEWDFSGNTLTYQWRPLIRWSWDDVLAIHKEHSVPLNPLYALGARRVGCWPCVMSRKQEIRIIAQKFPERIDEIREWENDLSAETGHRNSFFPSDKIPERFRSQLYTDKDGNQHKISTIDDVVKWSMTGKRAKGHYTDELEEDATIGCNSGFCE